ncbi:MAG: hypothetical protein Kow00117_08020 [Phototrophicales bacterium]
MEENNGCAQQSIIFMAIAIVFALLVFMTVLLVSLGIISLGGNQTETQHIEESITEDIPAEFTLEPEATSEPGE